MEQWLRGTLEAVAVVNLLVSIAIAVNAGCATRQKVAQIVLVWAIPFLGSVILGLFLWTQRGTAPPSRESSDAPSRLTELSEAVRSMERHRG